MRACTRACMRARTHMYYHYTFILITEKSSFPWGDQPNAPPRSRLSDIPILLGTFAPHQEMITAELTHAAFINASNKAQSKTLTRLDVHTNGKIPSYAVRSGTFKLKSMI